MRENLLFSLRDKLIQILPDFNHFIGVSKAIPQSQYPFISYIYAGETPIGDDTTEIKISIYFGVIEKQTQNKEYTGHLKIIQTIENIKTFLYKNRIFAQYVMDSKITNIYTDGGLQHPRYEGEIVLNVRMFDKPQEEEPLAKVITVEDKDGNTTSEVSSL